MKTRGPHLYPLHTEHRSCPRLVDRSFSSYLAFLMGWAPQVPAWPLLWELLPECRLTQLQRAQDLLGFDPMALPAAQQDPRVSYLQILLQILEPQISAMTLCSAGLGTGWVGHPGSPHPLLLPDLLPLVLSMVLGGLTMMVKPCQKGLQDPEMNDLLEI